MKTLPNGKSRAVFAEEPVLKVDHDRSDSIQLDAALHDRIGNRPTSQAWLELRFFYFVLTIAAILSAELQRGPPYC